MNTIQCWITREPKGEDEDDYYLHFAEPTLAEHNLCDGLYWQAEDSNDSLTKLIPSESYGLNYGECMEWVMVKKGDFEELQAKVKELQSIQTIKNSRPKGITL